VDVFHTPDFLLPQTTPLTLLFYPQKHRSRVGVVHKENRDLTDVEDLSKDGSDGGFRTRFAVVLDKLEQLPAVMTVTQLLSNSSSRSSLTFSESSSDEKASIRDVPPLRPVSMDALRLIELTERTSAVMISAEADFVLQTDPIVSVLRTFGTLNRVPVKASISVVNYDEYPNSVARHVDESSSQMLLVPWRVAMNEDAAGSSGFNPFDHLFKRTVAAGHSSEVVNSHYIRKVFAGTRADVCLIVDRGLSTSGTPSNQHIFLPFFGGPDDRLALSFVVQLCSGDSGVTATVVRIKKTGGSEVPEKEEINYNVRVSRLGPTEHSHANHPPPRLCSLIPSTATSPPKPALHPIPPMISPGVDTPPKSQMPPSARPLVGSSSAKSNPISPSTLSKPLRLSFDRSWRDRVRGGC
jgi:hypothetical protein